MQFFPKINNPFNVHGGSVSPTPPLPDTRLHFVIEFYIKMYYSFLFMNLVMDGNRLIIMHTEVVFQLTGKARLTKWICMMKMNTFVQQQNLAVVEKDEEKEKINQPSTSMAIQVAPSALTAAAAPAAAGGGKRQRKSRKVLNTVTVMSVTVSK